MPSVRYPFEPGGPDRVAVEWTGRFQSLGVAVDGRPLGPVPEGALKAGHRFTLAGGTTLEVQLVERPFPELHVRHQGVALPGSPGDPEAQVRAASHLIVGLGLLGAALGLVGALGVDFLVAAGFGGASVVFGLAFAGLGVATGRGQRWALWVAIAVYVLDTVSGLALRPPGGSPPVAALVVRTLWLWPMLRALVATRALAGGPPKHPAPPAPLAGAAAGQVPATPLRSASQLDATAEARRRELEARAQEAPGPRAPGGSRAAVALRFAAPKCELLPTGLRVMDLQGAHRDVPWGELAGIAVRRLPPDAPWDGKPVLEFTVSSGEPVRLVTTTLINFAPLPGGAAPSRLENLRRLVAHARASQPAASLDPETVAFVEGQGQPAQLPTLAALAAFDARHG